MSNIETLNAQLISKSREVATKELQISEKKSEITSYENDVSESEYIDNLNDLYGEVEICGQTYRSGYALLQIDPTAFNCGLNDYADSQREDSAGYKELESELEELEDELSDLEDEKSDIESEIEESESEEE